MFKKRLVLYSLVFSFGRVSLKLFGLEAETTEGANNNVGHVDKV